MSEAAPKVSCTHKLAVLAPMGAALASCQIDHHYRHFKYQDTATQKRRLSASNAHGGGLLRGQSADGMEGRQTEMAVYARLINPKLRGSGHAFQCNRQFCKNLIGARMGAAQGTAQG